MAAKSQEKIFFGVALLALIAAGAWTFLQQPKLAALRKISTVSTVQSAYAPVGVDASKVETSIWPAAPAQKRGSEWIYDVFTPPEIYYNEATKEFSVTPPTTPVVVKVEIPFGLDLVEIKQDVFRLQLVGYVGNAGSYLGTFENAITGETFLAKAGKKIPALGLTVRAFEVKRNLVPAKDSMPIYETVAAAVVVDDKTGDEVTLTNKKRFIKGTPIAVLKATGSDQLFEQKAGTSFSVGDVHYSVGAVTAEPASVEVTKTVPNSKLPETKTLTVSQPVEVSAPADKAAEASKSNQSVPAPAVFPPASAQ